MRPWLALLLCTGCFPVRYLSQAAAGEASMLTGARAIPAVIADGRTDAHTRGLLFQLEPIKRFAQREGLKPTRNYQRYSDLHRSAAVWVVQGCAPLSFRQRRSWQFPVVGSVPYLGFFDEQAARDYGAALARDEGLDVDVRGAAAFSTLGWFRDPVLSTMLSAGDEALGELVDTVLHESTHATVYVADQSAFDESLASFVAATLTPRWFAAHPGQAAKGKAYADAEATFHQRVAQLHDVYVALDAVYGSSRSDAEKQAEKARVVAEAQAALRLARPLNNASLAGYETYQTATPAFAHLLAVCGGEVPRFLGAVATLKAGDFPALQLADFGPVVERLAARGCPALQPASAHAR
jgi:predicted aminopeptidase